MLSSCSPSRDAAGKYLLLPENNLVDWSMSITVEQILAVGGTQEVP